MNAKKLNNTLNIFVSCSKDYYIPDNKYLVPIQVGAKNAKDIFAELRDDVGDNISELNPYLCEVTAQYWAWKNVKSEYYGFCHYRRYFSFSNKSWAKDSFNFYNIEKLRKSTLNDLGYCDDIFDEVKKYDLIVPVAADVVSAGHKSLYGHYEDSLLNVKDIDLMLDVIKDLSPEYYETAVDYINGRDGYFCNMFIMKDELFQEFCDWEFKILFEFIKRWDKTNYFIESLRTPGHIGERLVGIFTRYIIAHKNNIKVGYKFICKFDKIYFNSYLNDIEPAFPSNNVPIIMATNDHYCKFASATLISLMEHANPSNNYDVLVFSNNTLDSSKKLLQESVENYSNISIRFIDPTSLVDGFNLNERSNITVETFYRLLIPELKHYDKVIYLDSDMIILEDVAKLLNIDIEDNYFGGVIDVSHAATINHKYFDSKEYYSSFGVKNLYTFINAGVLIVNSKKLRENYSSEYLLFFAQQNAFRFQDQDLINVLFEGKIKHLDFRWNLYADGVESPRGQVNKVAPAEIYNGWKEASKNPFIIHYAGNEKPWVYPDYEFAEVFWKYFAKSPFYHSFILQNTAATSKPVVVDENNHKERFLRRVCNVLWPKNSRRRHAAKKILNGMSYIVLPKGSKLRHKIKVKLVKKGILKREI